MPLLKNITHIPTEFAPKNIDKDQPYDVIQHYKILYTIPWYGLVDTQKIIDAWNKLGLHAHGDATAWQVEEFAYSFCNKQEDDPLFNGEIQVVHNIVPLLAEENEENKKKLQEINEEHFYGLLDVEKIKKLFESYLESVHEGIHEGRYSEYFAKKFLEKTQENKYYYTLDAVIDFTSIYFSSCFSSYYEKRSKEYMEVVGSFLEERRNLKEKFSLQLLNKVKPYVEIKRLKKQESEKKGFFLLPPCDDTSCDEEVYHFKTTQDYFDFTKEYCLPRKLVLGSGRSSIGPSTLSIQYSRENYGPYKQFEYFLTNIDDDIKDAHVDASFKEKQESINGYLFDLIIEEFVGKIMPFPILHISGVLNHLKPGGVYVSYGMITPGYLDASLDYYQDSITKPETILLGKLPKKKLYELWTSTYNPTNLSRSLNSYEILFFEKK